MKNAIFVIKPYKWNGMWVFDDERVLLERAVFEFRSVTFDF